MKNKVRNKNVVTGSEVKRFSANEIESEDSSIEI